MNFNKNEKRLIIIFSFMLLGYIYYNYFLSPVLNKVQEAKQKNSEYESALNSLKLIKLTNEKGEKELAELKTEIKTSEEALPKSERNPEISYNLKVLGDKNKIVINSVDFGKPINYNVSQANNQGKSVENSSNKSSVLGNLNFVPVNLSISGDYESIINFAAAVEKDIRISEISSINISDANTANESSKDTLQASMSLNYYFLSENDKSTNIYDFNKGTYGKDNLFK